MSSFLLFFQAKSCHELYKSGKTKSRVYTIDPDGLGPFKVRCKMSTFAACGWTEIQRRINGDVDFNKYWEDYKEGFGDLEKEFWLGLDKIHRLTASGQTVLRFDLDSFEKEEAYVMYENFLVGSESKDYILSDVKYIEGIENK